MRTILIAAAALVGLSSASLAQTETTTTETTTTTVTTEVPAQVRTYVVEQTTPSITFDGEIVVGEPVPEIVEITPIPDNDGYGYAVLNDQRVLIDPTTRTVIEIVE